MVFLLSLCWEIGGPEWMVENYVLREKTDWTRLDIDANVVSFLVYAILNRTGIINVLQNALPLK